MEWVKSEKREIVWDERENECCKKGREIMSKERNNVEKCPMKNEVYVWPNLYL